jgi:Photosynthetic reaction centre cytochrome C subunit
MRTTMLRLGAVLAGAALLSACQLGTKTSQQYGYRGTGMDQVRLVSETKKVDPINVVPPPPYDPPPPGGRPAREAYQNVQVLGDVSEDQFSYTMAAITQWIAPEQGCNYCHNPANMASDEIYTKVVARRMLQMTRNINTGWTSHVKQTGVTCYTCQHHHRKSAWPEFADDQYGLFVAAQHRHGEIPAQSRITGNPRQFEGESPLRCEQNLGYGSGERLQLDDAHRDCTGC